MVIAMEVRVALTLVILNLVPYGLLAYPVFGTKRYGRSTIPMRRAAAPAWGVSVPAYAMPVYQPAGRVRNQMSHYPSTYYDPPMYPYSQDYVDDYYYPQESMNYQLYYPPARHDIYQTNLPYYRQAQQPYGYYGYDDASDPVDDLQEEMLHEEEREQREDALPIGQETWFEGEVPTQRDESMDDVNAAFLQNLIMSQMYNDALKSDSKNELPPQKNMEGYISGDDSDYFDDGPTVWYPEIKDDNKYYDNDFDEDEDVRELKSLPKATSQKFYINDEPQVARERKQWQQNSNRYPDDWYNWENKRNLKSRVGGSVTNMAYKKQEHSEHGPWLPSYSTFSFTDRKSQNVLAKKESIVGTTSSPSITTEVLSTESPAKDSRGGQKEVVLLRPATPVRHPFAEPVMELLSQQGAGQERKRTPSVYDTIRQLIEMEDNLKEKSSKTKAGAIHSNIQKRYVSNEASLVKELTGLKKTA